MRAYRQIAKNNSYLAAVSSGQSQGTTVLSEAITVNARVVTPSGAYPSKIKVTDSLLAQIAKDLDVSYYANWNTSSTELSTGTGLPYANKVSVQAESISEDGSVLLTSLGDVSFRYQKSIKAASLFNTTMSTIPFQAKTSGIIKSVGINVVTNSGVDTLAGTSIPRRRVLIPNPGLNAYAGSANFYYAPKKCFFCLSGNNIYKIPFDPDTFIFGTPVLVTTAFSYNTTSNRFASTNLKNKIFKQISSNQFLKFDFETETVSTVTTNIAIPTANTMAWDRSAGVMRYLYNSTYKGFTISESGTVVLNTGALTSSSEPYMNSTVSYIDSDKIMDAGNIFLNNIVPNVNNTAQPLSTTNSAPWSGRAGYIILDDNNVHVSFSSPANTANQGTVTFDKFPETMYTMAGNTPDIPISAGDQITVEFDFNILQ